VGVEVVGGGWGGALRDKGGCPLADGRDWGVGGGWSALPAAGSILLDLLLGSWCSVSPVLGICMALG
jgi:hypothetical protein